MAETADNARMQSLLTTLRQVGLPLLQAISEAQGQAGGQAGQPDAAPQGFNTEILGTLVDSTVLLSQKLAAQLGASDDQVDAWVRWALAGAAAQTVAAAYKTSGKALGEEDAARIATIAIDLQSRFKSQIPPGQETLPNTVATFRAKMMEAMVPVVGAVAQYSFGRAEHGLLAEVAERLVKTADQVTRALAPTGATPEEWRLLCWNVLKAAGQVYTEAHFAEADRLLYMDAEARAAYFAQHGQIVPMTQVWQSFNQRMAMLATLATYLDVPESARLDAGSW
ncbi:MAG: hypothetical protein P4M15_13675 [Alphaproteobacteria bacterium]|nr:hypothetical protein [Alphaproteobacteria bacterium]